MVPAENWKLSTNSLFRHYRRERVQVHLFAMPLLETPQDQAKSLAREAWHRREGRQEGRAGGRGRRAGGRGQGPAERALLCVSMRVRMHACACVRACARARARMRARARAHAGGRARAPLMMRLVGVTLTVRPLHSGLRANMCTAGSFVGT